MVNVAVYVWVRSGLHIGDHLNDSGRTRTAQHGDGGVPSSSMVAVAVEPVNVPWSVIQVTPWPHGCSARTRSRRSVRRKRGQSPRRSRRRRQSRRSPRRGSVTRLMFVGGGNRRCASPGFLAGGEGALRMVLAPFRRAWRVLRRRRPGHAQNRQDEGDEEHRLRRRSHKSHRRWDRECGSPSILRNGRTFTLDRPPSAAGEHVGTAGPLAARRSAARPPPGRVPGSREAA